MKPNITAIPSARLKTPELHIGLDVTHLDILMAEADDLSSREHICRPYLSLMYHIHSNTPLCYQVTSKCPSKSHSLVSLKFLSSSFLASPRCRVVIHPEPSLFSNQLLDQHFKDVTFTNMPPFKKLP